MRSGVGFLDLLFKRRFSSKRCYPWFPLTDVNRRPRLPARLGSWRQVYHLLPVRMVQCRLRLPEQTPVQIKQGKWLVPSGQRAPSWKGGW